MATSGTINGTRSGTKPYISIQWDVRETDIAGNRSKVRLRLYLVSQYNINFSGNRSGTLEGQNFTYSNSVYGPGTYLIRSRELWIGHNSDGTKSITFDANFHLDITWSGVWTGNLTVSGNATLNTIPRASSVSISGSSTAEMGKYQGIYVKINRADSSFTHQLRYTFGKKSGTATDGRISWVDHEWTIPTDLASELPTATSGWGSIQCDTFDKNGNKLGTSSVRFTATIPASWKPNVSNLTTAIAGNAVAKGMGLYVQSVSQVQASFSASATHSAYLTSTKIFVRKQGGSDSGTIHASSGTSHVLNGNGTYEVVGEAKDSRGRVSTITKTITVQAYNPPSISAFSATRDPNAETYVDIFRSGSTTSLSGKNTATLVISKRVTGGSWTQISSIDFTGTFSSTHRDSGNTVTKSYDFRLVVKDSFGKSTESNVSVSTSRVVFDIHKDEGIGVGKVHEKGILDVRGGSFFEGLVDVTGALNARGEVVAYGGFGSIKLGADTDLNSVTKVGFYYNNDNSTVGTMKNVPIARAFSLLVERHAGFKQSFTRYDDGRPETWVRNYYNGTWGIWINQSGEHGSNSTGDWLKLPDGTMITYQSFQWNPNNGSMYVAIPASYPGEFVAFIGGWNADLYSLEEISSLAAGNNKSYQVRIARNGPKARNDLTWNIWATITTIGRWK